jgi:molecular chaperone GrpE
MMRDETPFPFDSAMATETQPAAEDAVETSDMPLAPVDQQDYEGLNNRYLRLAADFDNFRKRQAQEREMLLKYGAQMTMDALLPVLDNLDRARQSLSAQSDPAMLYQSFEMLTEQLLDTLKSQGLLRLHPEGELFNPECHEAVSQTEKEDTPEYTILQVYQDGYMLGDRLLRPAMVKVATRE